MLYMRPTRNLCLLILPLYWILTCSADPIKEWIVYPRKNHQAPIDKIDIALREYFAPAIVESEKTLGSNNIEYWTIGPTGKDIYGLPDGLSYVSLHY